MRIKFLTSCLILLVLAASSRAQDARRDEITAAQGRALESLLAQVSKESIGDHLTVADLLRKTNGSKKLMKTLARAQQIGGPRWLDERTCEVRLDIPGTQVARALVEIATLDNRTPIAPEVLAGRLGKWDNRTFSSTGAAAIDLSNLDDAKRQACTHARRDAADQVLQRIRPIALADGKTVADALASPGVADAVNQWLDARPITRVEFRNGHQARVTLAVDGEELFDVFRASALKDQAATGAMDPAAWTRVHDEFVSRVAAVSGQAFGAGDNAGAPGQAAVVLPRTPPDWVDRQLDADASAPAGQSQLRAARAAEDAAVEKVRALIAPLELGDGQTVGEAAKQDPRIATALDRALARAQKSKVEYLSDGGARVTVRLDLQDLWDQLQAPR